jgi:hypothetical protein
MQDAIIKSEHKIKKAYPVGHIINWYLGNYLESPNNSIRDESFNLEKAENWKPIWFDDIQHIKNELKGNTITHSDFLKLVKEKGVHNKYYHYKKYENNCEACKTLGIR